MVVDAGGAVVVVVAGGAVMVVVVGGIVVDGGAVFRATTTLTSVPGGTFEPTGRLWEMTRPSSAAPKLPS